MSNIWSYWAKKNPFLHPATKQTEILERVILSASDPSDLILDPFAGSGTTGFVASALGRRCDMIEISDEYCKLIVDRLEGKYGEYKSGNGPKD